MVELLPGLPVSPQTLARLRAFDASLRKWSAAINLVAQASLAQSWERHILDSAQLFPLTPAGARRWADLGSGGGLPGLVIAILARETPLTLILVESDRRKAAFLRSQVVEHALNARVETDRAEALAPLGADVVTARALAPLDRLLPMVARHLASGGTALLPKGRRWDSELEPARGAWTFDLDQLPSASDPQSRILRLTQLRPRP